TAQFLQPHTSSSSSPSSSPTQMEVMSAERIRERLQSQLVTLNILGEDQDVVCVVCLNELNQEQDMSGLGNC
ncbi:hypothetical protein KI387_006220, partial [Taxus chinensis]